MKINKSQVRILSDFGSQNAPKMAPQDRPKTTPKRTKKQHEKRREKEEKKNQKKSQHRPKKPDSAVNGKRRIQTLKAIYSVYHI